MNREAKKLKQKKCEPISETAKTKKQSILLAAKSVFHQKGFNDAKISEIARMADVADGTIYEYFMDKEDLLFSITTDKWEETKSLVDWHLQGIKGALNKIRKYIWFCLDSFQHDPEYAGVTLLMLRSSRKFLTTPAYEHVRDYTKIILDLVKEGQEEGCIDETVDSEIVRRLVLGSVEHITTRWLLGGSEGTITQFAEPLSDLVIKAINKMPLESDYGNDKSGKALRPISGLD
jgi:TetR/AcrR family transcriptional regulator, fatty acid metabolism regulator protein